MSSLGAPTNPRVNRIHTMAGDIWRALARSMINNNWPLVCRKQTDDRKSRSVSNGKKYFFFPGLVEEKGRMPPASSRPLDHGSTRYLRRRPLHSLPLPDTKRVGRGLRLCRGGRPIVARAVFCRRVDTLQPEKNEFGPPAVV